MAHQLRLLHNEARRLRRWKWPIMSAAFSFSLLLNCTTLDLASEHLNICHNNICTVFLTLSLTPSGTNAKAKLREAFLLLPTFHHYLFFFKSKQILLRTLRKMTNDQDIHNFDNRIQDYEIQMRNMSQPINTENEEVVLPLLLNLS